MIQKTQDKEVLIILAYRFENIFNTPALIIAPSPAY